MKNTEQLHNCLGQRLTVFSQDHIGDDIRKFGLFEKERLLFLLKLLQALPQAVVLDIGANIGNHTLVFATAASQVHAFEPMPAIHALLARNIADNKLSHARAHALALSDCNDTATLHIGKQGNLGMTSFEARDDNSGTVTVNRRVGDEYLLEQGITHVDFLKIDVEGHEYFVLQGLRQTLERDLPLITLEWNDDTAIARFSGSDLWQFLMTHYSVHAVDTTHDRTVWQDKPFAWIKRKWHRLLPRRIVVHDFNPQWHYDCVLLIPKGREALLSATDQR